MRSAIAGAGIKAVVTKSLSDIPPNRLLDGDTDAAEVEVGRERVALDRDRYGREHAAGKVGRRRQGDRDPRGDAPTPAAGKRRDRCEWDGGESEDGNAARDELEQVRVPSVKDVSCDVVLGLPSADCVAALASG